MDIKIKVRKELIKDPNMREAVKNIEQMQYLENNDKMFEMLNAFSYDSKNYVDFIKKNFDFNLSDYVKYNIQYNDEFHYYDIKKNI